MNPILSPGILEEFRQLVLNPDPARPNFPAVPAFQPLRELQFHTPHQLRTSARPQLRRAFDKGTAEVLLRGTVGTEVKGLHHESTWEPRDPAMVTGCHRYFSKTPGYLWRYYIKIRSIVKEDHWRLWAEDTIVWSYKSWSGDAGTNLPQTSECKKSWEI